MFVGSRPDTLHLHQLVCAAERPVLLPVVYYRLRSGGAYSGQGIKQPHLGPVDVDSLGLRSLRRLGNEEFQAGEVGLFGGASGSSEKGFQRVAAGQRIVSRVGNGTTDGNAAFGFLFRR